MLRASAFVFECFVFETTRGEYIDFALLLRDTLYQSQTPEIQLRLDDLSSGPWVLPYPWSERKKR